MISFINPLKKFCPFMVEYNKENHQEGTYYYWAITILNIMISRSYTKGYDPFKPRHL